MNILPLRLKDNKELVLKKLSEENYVRLGSLENIKYADTCYFMVLCTEDSKIFYSFVNSNDHSMFYRDHIMRRINENLYEIDTLMINTNVAKIKIKYVFEFEMYARNGNLRTDCRYDLTLKIINYLYSRRVLF